MKIAFVTHDYHRHGGHARYVVELAERYRYEHEVHVFTNHYDTDDTKHLRFHYVPALRQTALSTILSFIIPASLQIDLERFDIVHAQGLCGFKHHLATVHFCQSGWFEEHIKQGNRLTWRQQLFRNLVTQQERRALCMGNTHRVIAISKKMQQDIQTYYHRSGPIDLIYHGVDLDRFHPKLKEQFRGTIRKQLGFQSTDLIAIYVGDAKKGLAAAIQAIAKAEGFHLLVVSGSDLTSYQELAERLDISNRVILHPLTKSIEQFFAAVDVFLFPTIYEPYGMVISEAMAMGLPVITSRSAGAAELIDHTVSGYLTTDAWNIADITLYLELLRDQPKLREQVGSFARQAIAPWTWDRCAMDTIRTYQQILDTR